VIERLGSMSGGIFSPLVDLLTRHDRYFHCADFDSYIEAQLRVENSWSDTPAWSRRSLLNTARSGRFSADRTIRQYAEEIWGVLPVEG
jgi:glycogen phosphorylase